MKKVHVGKNQKVQVNDEDFEWISQHTWESVRTGQKSFIRRSVEKGGKWQQFSLGAEILDRLGFSKNNDEYITFIDGNRFNFQQNNLVIIEKSLYHQRQPIVHKWKGVRYINKLRKFSITINLDKKFTKSIYQSDLEAAECYNKLAVKYYGQFAAVNNIQTSQVIWPPLVLVPNRRIRKPIYTYKVKAVLVNGAFDDIERWCPKCMKETCYLSNQGLTCLGCKWSLNPSQSTLLC
jgi:hypothetical protein